MPDVIATPPSIDKNERGPKVIEYLKHAGLMPRIPTIRSSDLGLAASAPFTYYLTRRLGITPLFTKSEALNRGSWFHHAFELYALHAPAIAYSKYMDLIEARCEEIKLVCKGLGWVSDKMQDKLQSTRLDAHAALAWYLAACDYKVAGNTFLATGFEGYFRKSHWNLLGTELVAAVSYRDTKLLAQFDRLYYNSKTETIWIVDAKTTGKSTTARCQSFLCSFQLQHYLYILENLVAAGAIQEFYKLPSSLKVGGMIHPVIEKPSIVLGQKDRDYFYEAEGKKTKVSGTAKRNKGVWEVSVDTGVTKTYTDEKNAVEELHALCGKKPTKAFSGEPSVSNYVSRVRDWYLAEGDYEGEQSKRLADPPVNVSCVTFHGIDEAFEREYLKKVEFIYDHATREPYPENFFRTEEGMTTFGNLSIHAPFYLAAPLHWPDLVGQNQFTILSREDETGEPHISI